MKYSSYVSSNHTCLIASVVLPGHLQWYTKHKLQITVVTNRSNFLVRGTIIKFIDCDRIAYSVRGKGESFPEKIYRVSQKKAVHSIFVTLLFENIAYFDIIR